MALISLRQLLDHAAEHARECTMSSWMSLHSTVTAYIRVRPLEKIDVY